MTAPDLEHDVDDEPTGAFVSGEDELSGAAEQPDEDRETPAAAGSPLGSLRERREQARKALQFDLEVPRIEGPIYVRFRPVPADQIALIQTRTARLKPKDRELMTNALVLVWACMGIFEVIDGREVSVDPDDRDGEWPKFDQQLARILGVRAGKASETVRALYLTDGDLISTAQTLAELSGYSQEQLERDGSGN